jgi:hypothetical protein
MASTTLQQLGPHEFSLLVDRGSYGVLAGDVALMTPGHRRLSTPNGAVINLLLDELGSWPYWYVDAGVIVSPRPLGTYTLLSWQLDAFEANNSADDTHLLRDVLKDPVLQPQPGPEQLEQRFAWTAIDDMLRPTGARIGHISGLNEGARRAIAVFAEDAWRAFMPAERAVADTLRQVHGSWLAALGLVLRHLSPDQFAHAILAASPLHGVFGFPTEPDTSPDEQHSKEYGYLRDQARTTLAYLAAAHMREAEVEQLMALGESERVEFKSTAIGFPGAKRRERRLATEKIGRTAAAIMSRDGGWVIIGVSDDGVPVGLPELADYSADDLQLTLADFLKNALGSEVASRIGLHLQRVQGSAVLVLTCPRAATQVSVLENGVKRFYVRQGPRTVRLDEGGTGRSDSQS